MNCVVICAYLKLYRCWYISLSITITLHRVKLYTHFLRAHYSDAANDVAEINLCFMINRFLKLSRCMMSVARKKCRKIEEIWAGHRWSLCLFEEESLSTNITRAQVKLQIILSITIQHLFYSLIHLKVVRIWWGWRIVCFKVGATEKLGRLFDRAF